MLMDLNYFDSNDPIMPQQKENVSDYNDESMAETKQFYKPIHPIKQRRQNQTQHFEGSEEYDNVVDPKTGWKCYKEQQWNLPHTPSSSSSFIMAEFFMAKLELMVVAFFKTWRKAVSDFFLSMQFRIAGT